MYTISKIEICNAALHRIGNENLISSLDDGSAEARVFKSQYDMSLASMLRSFPWRFARRIAELPGVDVETPSWQYSYSLPGDCLKVLKVVPMEELPVTDPMKYEIISTPAGGVLLTDIEDPSIEYTAWIEDPGLWDSSFMEAFTLKLASVVSLALTGSDSKTQELMKLSQYAWQGAAMQSSSESRTKGNITRGRYKGARG